MQFASSVPGGKDIEGKRYRGHPPNLGDLPSYSPPGNDSTISSDTLRENVRQLIERNGWAELEAFYAQVPVDQRHVIVRGVANEIRDKACFDAWISLNNSSIARTFKGAQYVNLAWYARRSAYADRVPKSAYKEFFSCLETARESVHGVPY
jgi:hypothetical protein